MQFLFNIIKGNLYLTFDRIIVSGVIIIAPMDQREKPVIIHPVINSMFEKVDVSLLGGKYYLIVSTGKKEETKTIFINPTLS